MAQTHHTHIPHVHTCNEDVDRAQLTQFIQSVYCPADDLSNYSETHAKAIFTQKSKLKDICTSTRGVINNIIPLWPSEYDDTRVICSGIINQWVTQHEAVKKVLASWAQKKVPKQMPDNSTGRHRKKKLNSCLILLYDRAALTKQNLHPSAKLCSILIDKKFANAKVNKCTWCATSDGLQRLCSACVCVCVRYVQDRSERLGLRVSSRCFWSSPGAAERFCAVADVTSQDMMSKSNPSSEESKALWLQSK